MFFAPTQNHKKNMEVGKNIMLNSINFVLGTAGSGKTWYSLYRAVHNYFVQDKKVLFLALGGSEYLHKQVNTLAYYMTTQDKNNLSFNNFFEWLGKDDNWQKEHTLPDNLKGYLNNLVIDSAKDTFTVVGRNPTNKEFLPLLEKKVENSSPESLVLDDLCLLPRFVWETVRQNNDENIFSSYYRLAGKFAIPETFITCQVISSIHKNPNVIEALLKEIDLEKDKEVNAYCLDIKNGEKRITEYSRKVIEGV